MATNVNNEATDNTSMLQNVQQTMDGKTTTVTPDTNPIISFGCPFPTLDEIDSPLPVTCRSQNNTEGHSSVAVASGNVEHTATTSQSLTCLSVTTPCTVIPYSGHVKLPAIDEIFGRKNKVPNVTIPYSSASPGPCTNQPELESVGMQRASANTSAIPSQMDCVLKASESVNSAHPSFSVLQTSTTTIPSITHCVVNASEHVKSVPQSIAMQYSSNTTIPAEKQYVLNSSEPSHTDTVLNALEQGRTGIQTDNIQQTSTNVNSSHTDTVLDILEPSNAAGQANLYNVQSSSSVNQNIWNRNGNSNLGSVVAGIGSTEEVLKRSAQQMPTVSCSAPQTYVIAGIVDEVQATQHQAMSLTYPYGNNSIDMNANSVTVAQGKKVSFDTSGMNTSTQVNVQTQSMLSQHDASQANSKTKTTDMQDPVAPQPIPRPPIQPMVFVPSKAGQSGTFEILSSAIDLSGLPVAGSSLAGSTSGEMPQGLVGFIEEFSKSPLPAGSVQEHLKRLRVPTSPTQVKQDKSTQLLEIDMRPVKQGRDETLELARKRTAKKAKSKTRQTLEDTNYSLPADSNCVCGSDVYCEEIPYEQVFIRNGQMYRLPDANVLRMADFEIYGFLKEDEWYISLSLFFTAVGFDVRKLYEVAMMYSNNLSILTLGDNELELLIQKSALCHQTTFKELISTSCIQELSKSILESNPNTHIVSQLASGEYGKRILGNLTKCSNCGLWVTRKETQDNYALLVKPPEIQTNCRDALSEETVTVNIGNLRVNSMNFVVFEIDKLLYISLKEVIRNKLFTLATIQQRLQKIDFMPIRAPKEVDEQFQICGTPVQNTLWIDMWSLSSVCCMGRVTFNGRRDDIAHSISSRKWQFQQTFSLVAEDTRKVTAHFTIDPATLEILEKSEPFHVAEPESKTAVNKRKLKTETSDVCVSSTTEENVFLNNTEVETEMVQDAARCLPISGNLAFSTEVMTCNTIDNTQQVLIESIPSGSTNIDNTNSCSYPLSNAFTVDDASTIGRPRKRKPESDVFPINLIKCPSKRQRICESKNTLKSETGQRSNVTSQTSRTIRLKVQTKQKKDGDTPVKSHSNISVDVLPTTKQHSHDNTTQPGKHKTGDRKASEITLSYGEYVVPNLDRFMKQMEKGELRFTRKSLKEKKSCTAQDNITSWTLPRTHGSQLLQADEINHADDKSIEQASNNLSNVAVNLSKSTESTSDTLTGVRSSEDCDVTLRHTDEESDNTKQEPCMPSSEEGTTNMNRSKVSPRMKLNYSINTTPTKTTTMQSVDEYDQTKMHVTNIEAMTVDDLLDRYETRMAVRTILPESPESENDISRPVGLLNDSGSAGIMSEPDDVNKEGNLIANCGSNVMVSSETMVSDSRKESVEHKSKTESNSGDAVSEGNNVNSNIDGSSRAGHDSDSVPCLDRHDKHADVINCVATPPKASNKHILVVGNSNEIAQQPDTNVEGTLNQEIISPSHNNSPTKQQTDSVVQCYSKDIPLSPIKQSSAEIERIRKSFAIPSAQSVVVVGTPTKSAGCDISTNSSEIATPVQQTGSSPGSIKSDTMHFSSSKRVERIRKEFESQHAQYSPDISLQILAATATAVDEDSEISDVESERDLPRSGWGNSTDEIQQRVSILAPVAAPKIGELIKHVSFSKEIRDGRVIFRVAKFQPGMHKLFPALFKPPHIEQKQEKFKSAVSEYMTENFYKFQKEKHAKALAQQQRKSTNKVLEPANLTNASKLVSKPPELQKNENAECLGTDESLESVQTEVVLELLKTNELESVQHENISESLEINKEFESVQSVNVSSEPVEMNKESKSLQNENVSYNSVETNKEIESVRSQQVSCQSVEFDSVQSEKVSSESEETNKEVELKQMEIPSESITINNILEAVETNHESVDSNDVSEDVNTNLSNTISLESVNTGAPVHLVDNPIAEAGSQSLPVTKTNKDANALQKVTDSDLVGSHEKPPPGETSSNKSSTDIDEEHCNDHENSNKDINNDVVDNNFEKGPCRKGLKNKLRTRHSKMSESGAVFENTIQIEKQMNNEINSGKSFGDTISSDSDQSGTRSLRKRITQCCTTNTDDQIIKSSNQIKKSNNQNKLDSITDSLHNKMKFDRKPLMSDKPASHTKKLVRKQNSDCKINEQDNELSKLDSPTYKSDSLTDNCGSERDTSDHTSFVTDSTEIDMKGPSTCTKINSRKHRKRSKNDDKNVAKDNVPGIQSNICNVENESSIECIGVITCNTSKINANTTPLIEHRETDTAIAKSKYKTNENLIQKNDNSSEKSPVNTRGSKKNKRLTGTTDSSESIVSRVNSINESLDSVEDTTETISEKTNDISTSSNGQVNSQSGSTDKVADSNDNGSDISTNMLESTCTDPGIANTPDGRLAGDTVEDNCMDRVKYQSWAAAESVILTTSETPPITSVVSCSQLPENLADPGKIPIVKLSNFLPKVLPQEILEKSPHLRSKQVTFHCGRRKQSPVKNNFMEGLELSNTLSPQPLPTHSKRRKRGTMLAFSSDGSASGVGYSNKSKSEIVGKKTKESTPVSSPERTSIKTKVS